MYDINNSVDKKVMNNSPLADFRFGPFVSTAFRVRVPMGVVGMIYEARTNVTADVAALTIKSGNAVILRGGSAAQDTNAVIVDILRQALDAVDLPADLVSTVDAAGREGARALMHARGLIDVLVRWRRLFPNPLLLPLWSAFGPAELRKIKAKKRNAKRWARFSLSLLLISVFSLSFLRF